MKEAMEKGMLLDIGHTSDRTQEDMWELSQANYSYPLNAFHAWPRSRMVEEIKSPDLPDAVRLLIRQNLGRGLTIPEQRVPNEWHLSDRALDMIEETGGIYGQRLGVADYVDYPDSGVVSPSNGCGKGTSLEAAQVLAWLLDRGLDVAYALDFHPAEGLKPREVRAGEACGPPSSSFEMRVVDPDPVPGPVDPDSGRAPKAEKAILDEDGYAFYKKGLNHVGRMAGFHFDLADIGLDRRYIDELKNRSAERFLQMWEQSEALAEKLNTEDANNANNEDSL